jgi:hypothetical protein
MSRAKAGDVFVELFKSLLKDAGFRCRGHRCTASGGDLQVELSFRNRWGYAIPDVYIEISDEEVGDLLQGDIRHLFRGYNNLRAAFSDEDLLAMDAYTESRVRGVVVEEVVPQALALASRDVFLEQLDAGRFAKSGVYVHAVTKLRLRDERRG